MKYILTITFLFIVSLSQAQRIFVVDRKDEANKVIYKTKYFSEASLVVCRTYDIQDTAKKYHWFFVDSKYRADWVVYYTSNPSEADYIVFLTNRKGLLGAYSANSPVDPIVKKTKYWTLKSRQ